jgi:hypothetical protein
MAIDDFEQTQLDLMQRRKKAQEGQTFNAPEGQMVSGRYVAPNFLQVLAEGLRSYSNIQDEKKLDKQLSDLRGERKTAMADALRTFTDKATGAPAVASTTTPTQMPSFDEADAASMQGIQGYGATTGAQAARAPDMAGAYASLLKSPDSAMRSAGMTGMARIPELEAAKQERVENRDFRKSEMELARQARADEAAANRAQRMQELEMRSEDQRLSQQERLAAQKENRELMMQNQREMAKLQASLRPERNVTVLGPNGEAITVPQSQSQGLPLYNPQAAGNLQKEKTKGQAKEQLSGVVQQLNNSYTALEQGGGITSTAQGGLSNLGARLGSTGLGQAVGGALGTANQRQRQEIEQTRPLLLNLIKDATGMTASQMNSNAEMQLYLKAATDPTLTVEANRSALANLDKMFGLGIAKPPADAAKSPATPAAAAPVFDAAKEQRYQQWLKSQGR